MVMRRPIFQVGWLSASATVTVWSFSEGPAAGGEDEFGDVFAAAGAEALVGAVMFAIDRDHLRAVFLDGGHDEAAPGDEGLFIGEAHRLLMDDGFVGGFQAGDADDGRHDEINFRGDGDGDAGLGAIGQFRFLARFVEAGGE
jgi:hypothetical protein